MKFGHRITNINGKAYYFEWNTKGKIHRIGLLIPMCGKEVNFKHKIQFLFKCDIGNHYRFLWFAYGYQLTKKEE